MKLKIYRGTEQIGGNIVEISTKSTKIILDCGRNLPPLEDPKAVDNIEIEGLTNGDSVYDAVFVTHHHADHCGLLGRVKNDIPIYMSDETKGVLGVIADFIDAQQLRAVETIVSKSEIQVRDMKILPIRVHHNAKGAVMFLVEADGQRLVYTGDFNAIDEEDYAEVKKSGEIDVLLCEGTNISVNKGYTEEDVNQKAAEIMEQTPGYVFVLCSTTNIDRIKSIEDACVKSGRTMAVDIFMLAIMDIIKEATDADKMALPFQDEQCPVGFVPRYIDKVTEPRIHKYFEKYYPILKSAKEIAQMDKLVFMIRQTMGGFLINLNKHKPLTGSKLIYSMWRGYESTVHTKKFLELCRSLGMEIEYLHASGHAYKEGLKSSILLTDPCVLVPIHTENASEFNILHKNVVTLEVGKEFDVGLKC